MKKVLLMTVISLVSAHAFSATLSCNVMEAGEKRGFEIPVNATVDANDATTSASRSYELTTLKTGDKLSVSIDSLNREMSIQLSAQTPEGTDLNATGSFKKVNLGVIKNSAPDAILYVSCHVK